MVRKREVSPTSRAQVRAVIGTNAGNSPQASKPIGQQWIPFERVQQSRVHPDADRSMCSRQSLSSGRMLSLTSSLVDISSAK